MHFTERYILFDTPAYFDTSSTDRYTVRSQSIHATFVERDVVEMWVNVCVFFTKSGHGSHQCHDDFNTATFLPERLRAMRLTSRYQQLARVYITAILY